jgi:hypothetical protein
MSEFILETPSTSIKGKTVYMVLYNYGDYNYSVMTIMEKLDAAYNYICEQEYQEGVFEKFKMIEINHIKELQSNFTDEHIHICYISKNYIRYNLNGYAGISSYIIVPMKIE